MAAHLLNRAGFGGTPAEIQNLADLGHEGAVASLLDYEKIPDSTPAPAWAQPDPARMQRLRDANRNGTPEEKKQAQREEQQLQQQRMLELRGWWIQRMVQGPRPFQEKMVLFWHGHFATSFVKVRDAYYMWRQNELFRRLATDNWLRLLIEAGKDPAMLIWLDQALSRKQHPNENYARESMELFSLGEGHYTEKDVIANAHALTGWSLDRLNQKYIYRPAFHDNGVKTFLGQTGNFDGDDTMRIIVEQPQAAKFITAKIWNYFAGQMPSDELNDGLAAVLRYNGNDFKPFLRVMFRSGEFYDASVVRNLVKSPVQWLVGSLRMLQCEMPPPAAAWGITRSMGQDLFAPPNVKGWDGGLSWITTNTLLLRYNEAAIVVDGDYRIFSPNDFARKQDGKGGEKIERRLEAITHERVDVEKIITAKEREDKNSLAAALEHRLLQTPLKSDQQKALRDFLNSRGELDDDDIRVAIRLVMATPDYQIA